MIVTSATGFMWVPYVAARVATRGLAAIANRDPGEPPDPPWAERASRAHKNAIENLTVFAPIVLVGAITGFSNPATVLASKVYVGARIAHYLIFLLGIPIARTAVFLVGAIATLVMAATIVVNAH